MAIRHETMYLEKRQMVAAKEEPKSGGGNKRKSWEKKKNSNKKGNDDNEKRIRTDIICHKCREPGHFSNKCPNGPRCFLCHQGGHMKKDCPNQAKEGQVVRVYALNAVPSSSIKPTALEKGKGVQINLEGMFSVCDKPV